MKEFQ